MLLLYILATHTHCFIRCYHDDPEYVYACLNTNIFLNDESLKIPMMYLRNFHLLTELTKYFYFQ